MYLRNGNQPRQRPWEGTAIAKKAQKEINPRLSLPVFIKWKKGGKKVGVTEPAGCARVLVRPGCVRGFQRCTYPPSSFSPWPSSSHQAPNPKCGREKIVFPEG